MYDVLSGGSADHLGSVFIPQADVNGNFNALLARVARQYSNGLQFAVNYRWSKSMDESSSGEACFCTNQTTPRNLKLEWGPSDYDATHNVNAFAVYDLPFYRGKAGLLPAIAGGWQISGTEQWNTGFPWTPKTFAGCITLASGQCFGPIRPIGIKQTPIYSNSNSALMSPTTNFPGGGPAYFVTNAGPGNTIALTTPPAVGRNSFRGPNYESTDMSIVKFIPIGLNGTERMNVELRLNAFNVFNKLNLLPFGWADSNTFIENQNFGHALGAGAGRVVEVQARLNF
jgi:hypothetical protein